MRQPDDRLKGSIKGDTGRRARLAAELRANLRRRKVPGRRPEPQEGSAGSDTPEGPASAGPPVDPER